MDFVIKRPSFKNVVYNVLDYGAKNEINFNNRHAFQKAIDDCSANGGGVVLVPNGYY